MKLTIRSKRVQALADLLICLAFAHACYTFLLICLAFAHACHSLLLICLAFAHACCLTHSAKQNGLRNAPFLFRRGSGSPVARSRIAGAVIRISWFTSGLRVFCGDPDGSTRGRGGRRRRGVGAFLRDHIGFVAFSAGSTLGLRAPNLRQRVFDSLDSLHAAAGLPWCVFAALVRFCATASALLGFPRGVRWGYAPQTAPKSQKWKRHCRLSGLSSRCGGVALVRIRAVTRVHGKTRPSPIYARAGRAVLR